MIFTRVVDKCHLKNLKHASSAARVFLSFFHLYAFRHSSGSPNHPNCPSPSPRSHFPSFLLAHAHTIATAHLLLMVEYVYGRYDFVAEDDDEISFSAGERIEVIKKDEIDQNGWWEVRSRSLLSISPIFLSSQRILISCSRRLPCPSLTYSLYLRFLLPTF